MDTFIRDIRYGVRMLVKSPAFSVVAIITLALGIGANTAIFSVVNSVLLNPLPFSDPDRLLVLRKTKIPVHPEFSVSPGNFLDWQSQATVFEQLAAYRTTSFNFVPYGGDPERVRAARVSAGTFTMLGIQPARGRDFLPEEDQEGRGDVAAISNSLWQRRFGGDPGIIGQPIKLSGRSYTIVAIMPGSFQFPEEGIDVWVPNAFTADERQAHGAHYLSVVGRLKQGVTIEQARAEMETIAQRLAEQYPDSNAGWSVMVTPMLDYTVRSIKPALIVLLGAVGFVLLISCANVANLLLARAAARQKEIAIRTALGSNRWRIVRQLMTESLLLAIIGGGAGLLLAVWGIDGLLALAPEDLPRVKEVGMDGSVLLFTLGVTLATGLGFGVAPALHASRPNLNETLKDAGRGTSAGVRRQRIRSLLVVSEVALAFVLLVGGTLLIRSFYTLQQVDPGFNPENALAVTISLPSAKYQKNAQMVSFFDQLIKRVSALPGVESVGGTYVLPIIDDFILGVEVEGRPQERDTDLPKTNYFAVTPGYFRAMGIPLIRGRDFTERDVEGQKRVVIINRTMADALFPGEDPIGKRIHITMGEEIFREIVGVVGDVKQNGLDQQTKNQTYEPFAQDPSTLMKLIVRSSGDPTSLAGAIRSEVLALDREQPLNSVRTLSDIISASIAQQRFSMLLLCVFAAVALALAAVGLYGVMSYGVTQRTHEIGIRMALGASRKDVVRMVAGQGASLAGLGIAIGLGAAWALTRLMESLLFQVSATDTLAFTLVPLLLAGVALAASFIPARRASKVDPMIALRYE
ncbi:MAG TPA: ABC transporter permease [Blastocatellia bacterium]|nr:ABC transporter permease [Blastocatellia bacterium]